MSFDYQWKNTFSPELECNEKRVWELLSHTGLDRGFFTDKHCLDAGCGTGRWTYAMQRMGATVDSFDISEPAVEATRLINPTTFKQDIMDLKPNQKYDFVLCWGVLHHLEHPWEGFKQLASQVRHGGLLHVMVYHKDTQKVYEKGRAKWPSLTNDERLSLCQKIAKRYRDGVHGWWDAYSPRFNRSYHEDEVRKWFIDSGFKDVKLIEKYSINMIGCKE